MCEVGSIRQIHARLKSEGRNVSEYAIRLWVKRGQLPAVYVGSKALISYANIMAMLEGNCTTMPS